jgi:hypothetical protein
MGDGSEVKRGRKGDYKRDFGYVFSFKLSPYGCQNVFDLDNLDL